MVLKKNNRQITFLHVYHHCSIFVIWWAVVYIAPNGETYFSAALNSGKRYKNLANLEIFMAMFVANVAVM